MMSSFLLFCSSRPFFRESETKKGCDTLYTSEKKKGAHNEESNPGYHGRPDAGAPSELRNA